MYKHKLYLIETLTNTSVGSGDVNFGTVDILVQKDPVTFLPVFNSSSAKGAIREHMEQFKGGEFSEDDIKTIFGEEKNRPGAVKFYDARLLTLPLRASQKVFYHSSSQMAILDYLNAMETFCKKTDVENLKNFIENLDFSDNEFVIFTNEKGLEIEDYGKYKSVDANSVSKLIKTYLNVSPENLAIFNDDVFSDICENSLPVIARNKIGEDGTSENLFYEEVLPRRSKLWFMLGFGKNIDTELELENKFENKLTSDLIQFGGNASIGYGVTKISLIGGE